MPADVFEEEHLTLQGFPALELLAYRTTFEGEQVKQATHDIGVRWTVVGPTEVLVTKHVERLVRATTGVLWNSTLDTRVQCGPIRVMEEDYSPMAPTPSHPFQKSGLTLVQVPVWMS